MEEEKEKGNKSSFPIKLIGFLFVLLALPFKFFIANPKVFLVILAIAVSVVGTVYVARKKPQLLGIQGQSVDQTQQSKEETENLVKEVGEIIALPEGEIPTLATVTDLETVKDQTFFARAQNGDRVLIYSSAKKAYLYRPSEKKIIEVGVVNLNQPKESVQMNGDNSETGDLTPTLTISVTSTPTQRLILTPTMAP